MRTGGGSRNEGQRDKRAVVVRESHAECLGTDGTGGFGDGDGDGDGRMLGREGCLEMVRNWSIMRLAGTGHR
jgi:hypothetical protein